MIKNSRIYFVFITSFLLSISVFGITYNVTYTYTATPTLGITETSKDIRFFYPFIDKALASPTQVGTVVVIFTKSPIYDKPPFKMDLILDGEYFRIYGDELVTFPSFNAIWEGELITKQYNLKEKRYNMYYTYTVGESVNSSWSSSENYTGKIWTKTLISDVKFKRFFDLSHKFRLNYKFGLKLVHRIDFNLKYETQVIPTTTVIIEYQPKEKY
ncbi:MAG: hypothetical protein J7L34_06340 [Thermotogaceae bacterium]|nr:hypothetical protein [Thermotogaceae bacterium]